MRVANHKDLISNLRKSSSRAVFEILSSRLHAPRRNSSLRTLAPTFSTIGYHHLILLGPTTQNDELCASRKVKPSLHGICLGEKGLWLWVYSRHDRFTSYLCVRRTATWATKGFWLSRKTDFLIAQAQNQYHNERDSIPLPMPSLKQSFLHLALRL